MEQIENFQRSPLSAGEHEQVLLFSSQQPGGREGVECGPQHRRGQSSVTVGFSPDRVGAGKRLIERRPFLAGHPRQSRLDLRRLLLPESLAQGLERSALLLQALLLALGNGFDGERATGGSV